MKRIMGFMLVLVLSCTTMFIPTKNAVSVQAAESDYEYEVLEGNTCAIEEYNGEEDVVVIPETIDGYTVVALEERTFYLLDKRIEEVIIPATVTEIETGAFFDCGDYIDKITVAAGNTSYKVVDGILYDMAGTTVIAAVGDLTGATILDGVTTIGNGAFSCSDIEKLVLPESVTTIECYAFNSSGIEEIVLNANLTTIEDRAFRLASNLTTITVASNNPNFKMVNGILYNTEETRILAAEKDIEGAVVIPAQVTSIDGGAFSECRLITSAVIPEGIETLPYAMFECCTKLESVTLPNSLKTIDYCVFEECTSLTELTIPQNVETIEIGIVSFCSNLKKVINNSEAVIDLSYAGNRDEEWRNAATGEVIESIGKGIAVCGDVTVDNDNSNNDSNNNNNDNNNNDANNNTNNDVNNDTDNNNNNDNSNADTGNDTEGMELVLENGKFVYYENGVANFEKYGYVDYEGSRFLIANGVIATEISGLAYDPESANDWYYLANGQVQTQYTGLALYDGAWFYVNSGKLDTAQAGYVEFDGSLFYVAVGQIKTEVNGLAADPVTGKWYYLANGQVQTQYTGLAQYDGAWFYVVNGALAEDYIGNVDYDGATFYVVNGKLQ